MKAFISKDVDPSGRKISKIEYRVRCIEYGLIKVLFSRRNNIDRKNFGSGGAIYNGQ